ncbi:hypothetical protein V6Z11_A03G072500 [Gossypium hirsutum]
MALLFSKEALILMTFDLFILKLPYFLSISFLLQSSSLTLSFSMWFLANLGTLSTRASAAKVEGTL